jgi:cell division protease FtsH
VVAHHEMGHALVAAALPGTDPVHKISIIPRGVGALGYTIQRPIEDRYIMVKDELEKKMAVLLGGRAAERIIFNHLSTGAADDLAKVTQIARNMITRYAMIPALGQVTYDDEPAGMLGPGLGPVHRRDYSDTTAREIDGALRGIVEEAFERALAILEQNRGLLEEGARLLLEKETLSEAELVPLFARVSADVTPPRPVALPASAAAASS